MIKIGAVAWGLPGGGYFAPWIAREAGLDGIQLELGSYDAGYPLYQKEIREEYKRAREELGIEYPSIVLNDVMCHAYIYGEETKDWEIACEQVELALEVAADLEIGQIMIPNFENNLIKDQSHVEKTIRFLEIACEKALPFGVDVLTETALEYHQQIALMEAVNKKNLKLFFDSQNYRFFSGLNQAEQLEALYPYMTNQLHLKDGIDFPGGKLMGEGAMQFAEQAGILREKQFSGWLILENYYNQLPIRGNSRASQMELLKRDIALVRKTFGMEGTYEEG